MATVAENSKKSKKGRPDIYTRTYGEKADYVRDLYIDLAIPDNIESARGKADEFYKTEACHILSEYDNEAHEQYITPKGNFRYQSILIQIGRMYRQDGFSVKKCVTTSRAALEMIADGYTVHQVAQMIRNYRLSHRQENSH